MAAPLRTVRATLYGVLFAAGGAWAHGDVVATRGGLAVPAGEHAIELVVPAPGKVSVYVDDHGTAVSVSGAEGTLVVFRRNGEADGVATLRPTSANRLEGEGVVLRPGDRLQVAVKLPDGQVVVAKATMP